MPKVNRKKKRVRHDPLLKQMTEDPGYLKAPKKNATSREHDGDDDDDLAEEKVESTWITQKVLENARAQQIEIAEEEKQHSSSKSSMALSSTDGLDSEDEEEIGGDGEEEEYEEIEVSAEDEKMLSMFMSSSKTKRRTLADIIMEKIAEHEARKSSGHVEEEKPRLHPKVQEVFMQVGKFLSHYTSGKVPKPFKIIPTMRNWEEVLQITSPESWTPQAMFIATRMFSSRCTERVAQRFYMLVLLPRFRLDIEQHKRLNYHLYRAVKKAIFKPTAFFRGLLLPLAMDNCTVREAVIMSSILAKCSIPVLYAAVGMMKLAMMEYKGTQTIFLKTLLNKKYTLPVRVIDALVQHFTIFFNEERGLPVIWHQCLLVFVQRYKRSLSTKQSSMLRALSRKQHHRLISVEVRRELASVADQAKRSRSSSTIAMSTE